MISLIKKLVHPVLKKLSLWYFSRARVFRYKDIKVKVYPSIFPPHYTISTKLLLEYIEQLNLQDKSVLELGCGSGVVSILAAKKGAKVTASDINKVALEALRENSITNKVEVKAVYSNLFDNLSISNYDYIFINPPYYPKEPKTVAEQAWFCGGNFEYFEKLFSQISESKNTNSSILMILSDTCDLVTIKNIANQYFVTLEERHRAIVLKEENFIFKVSSI